jgi:hypothetical protein
MGRLQEIVFESRSAPTLARFWAAALDFYAVRPYDRAEIERLAALGLTPETDPTVLVDGPGPSLCFHQVPERNYTNNRVHLDIAAPDRAAEVERLLALGARVQREADGYTVMLDPEGNQFCVAQSRTG